MGISTTEKRLLRSTLAFGDLFGSARFSDFRIVLRSGAALPVHKVILAAKSDFFAAAFQEGVYRESVASEMRLDFHDPRGILETVIKFLYTGQIKISSTADVIPALAASELLGINELTRLLRKTLSEVLNSYNAVQFLREIVEYGLFHIADDVIDALVRNFDHLAQSDLAFAPVDVFWKIAEHPMLGTVNDEFDYYQMVTRYIQASIKGYSAAASSREVSRVRFEEDRSDMTDADAVASVAKEHVEVFDADGADDKTSNIRETIMLYELVHFEKLSLEQLDYASANLLVPLKIVNEALRAKLRRAAGLPLYGNLFSRYRMSKSKGKHFNYVHDFDEHGVFFFLGTLYSYKFVNPHSAGRVKADMSTHSFLVMPASLVSRDKYFMWTMKEKNPWISIDLGEHWRLRPTHYTLRHGHTADQADNLTDWAFQGRKTGIDAWETISIHRDENKIGGSFGTWTFLVETRDYYSSFRILVTAERETYLICCGIELYGHLVLV